MTDESNTLSGSDDAGRAPVVLEFGAPEADAADVAGAARSEGTAGTAGTRPQPPEEVEAVPVEASDAEQPEDAVLTEAERRQVDAFVDKIDIGDSAAVLSYGVGTQRKIADFSQGALDNVRTKDLGAVGDELSSLVAKLGELNPSEEKEGGFLGLFRRKKDQVTELKARYGEVEDSVHAISSQLEAHQRTLLKDIDLLDRMYQLNEDYFRELTMYVVAGKKRLARARDVELAALQRKADETGRAEDAQAARDFAERCDRLEKRVYDLELTRQVVLQTAPQIRMVQASDAVMAEKIQTTVVNTIPLWKNQMVIALGIEDAARAAAAQRQVTDMTNSLLRKNADALKTATTQAARESERGIVDIETLRYTNEQLISTLNEVIQIQRDGREKRRAAEAELAQIEGQLKQKLLEASGK